MVILISAQLTVLLLNSFQQFCSILTLLSPFKVSVAFRNVLKYYRQVRKSLYALILIISHRIFIVYINRKTTLIIIYKVKSEVLVYSFLGLLGKMFRNSPIMYYESRIL